MLKGHISIYVYLQTSANSRFEMNRVNAKKVIRFMEICYINLLTAVVVTHAAICSCFLTRSWVF